MLKNSRRRSEHGYFVSVPKIYEPIMNDDCVRRWFWKLKRKDGWRSTAPVFLRTLHKFVEYSGKSPSELVALAIGDQRVEGPGELVSASFEVTNVVQRFVNEILVSGKRESARLARACLKSFFKSNGVSLRLDPIDRVAKKTEIVPSKEQVYAMADHAGSPRNRAIILCMYQSGLGINTLRNLSYAQVKEQLEKGRVPIRVHITPDVHKKASRATYYTFFGVEACEALSVYLDERKRKIAKMKKQGKMVEQLTKESPLFASEGRNVPFGGRMAVSSVWRLIKNSAEKVGLQRESIWPNCLRKAFEAELDRSLIDENTKKFLMGRPLPEVKYDVDEVEWKYSMCRFDRIELDKLAIIKEFVRSVGVKELEKKIRRVRAENPRMSEEDAVRFVVREELGNKR